MNPSAQLTLEQVKEIIEDNMKTDHGTRVVQEQVDDEGDLDPDNTSSVINTLLSTITNEFEHECLDAAVRLLNANPIRQSTDDRVPGHIYSIPGLPGTKFLAHQVCAIHVIVRRWVWDSDMPGALVPDEMCLGKTFTSVAATMICNLLTEIVVIGLPPTIVWGDTHEAWVNLAQNDFPWIIGYKPERYLLWRQNTVPRRHSEIQATLRQGHPARTSDVARIVVVAMPKVAEMFKSVIDEMTYGINFELINVLHKENTNLTDEDRNTTTDKPDNRWKIHLVSYDTIPSRAKQSSNSHLSHCSWSCGIVDECHHYKMKNCLGRQISMNGRIQIIHQVTATPGFHSLQDYWSQTMWLCSGVPEDPEDHTGIEKHGTESLYSAVQSLMHATRNENWDAQQDVTHRMMHIAKPWTITRSSESGNANGKPLVCIPKENAHLGDLEWTEAVQAELTTLVDRYISRGASGVRRVHIGPLTCFSLV